MKRLFNALMMSFSMFSVIPCPFCKWDDDLRSLSTLFLPAVGLFIGALWTLLFYFLNLLLFPVLVKGAVLTAFPFLISGSIHMDGFMDTVDAVRSYKDKDEKRKILKDPHVGSFAVIFAVLLLIIEFALLSSMKEDTDIFPLILIPVVSRCMSSIFVMFITPMSESQYSGVYRKGINVSYKIIAVCMLTAAVIFGFAFLKKYGFISLAVIAGSVIGAVRAYCSLSGMSGDVAGYSLVIGEFCGIALYTFL